MYIGTLSDLPAKKQSSQRAKTNYYNMNNSPERRVNGYVISQSKIHFQDRQSFALCCCTNRKKFLKKKKPRRGFRKDMFSVHTVLTTGATRFTLPIQTGFPCILLTRNMIPTNMKKKGPRKPKRAIHLVP